MKSLAHRRFDRWPSWFGRAVVDPRVYPVCTRIVCPWFRRGEWEITARALVAEIGPRPSPPRRRDLGLTGLGHRPPALDASSRSSLRSTQAAASSRVRRGVGAAHRRGGVCRTDRCGGLHCRSVPDGATAPRVATHPLFAPTPATSARTGWSSSTPTQTFWSSGLSTRLPGARASDLEVTPSCEQPARIGPQAAQCEGAAWIQERDHRLLVQLGRHESLTRHPLADLAQVLQHVP